MPLLPTVPLTKPHGIYGLGPAGYESPATDGQRLRLSWPEVETQEGVFDWAKMDECIALAKTNNKQIGASVSMLATPPSWLLESGARLINLPVQADGDIHRIVLPWDPIVKPRIRAFIREFADHCDGLLNFVAMGGLGCVIESYITPDPLDIGLDIDAAHALWTDSCNFIIDVHARNFRQTPFIFTAAKPFHSKISNVTLDTVVRNAATKYPNRFGVMNCSLAAKSDTGYPPHRLVNDLSATNPTGLQFLTSSLGFKGHDLGGTLEEALEAAVNLKAHWVEVYPYDITNPANLALLRDVSARLAN